MPGNLWTSEEMEIADRMFAAGARSPEIAAALGRTIRSVQLNRKRRHARGLEIPVGHIPVEWSAEEIALVDRLVNEGVPVKAIAPVVNRSADAVVALRRRRRLRGEPVPTSVRLRGRTRSKVEAGRRRFDFDDTEEL